MFFSEKPRSRWQALAYLTSIEDYSLTDVWNRKEIQIASENVLGIHRRFTVRFWDKYQVIYFKNPNDSRVSSIDVLKSKVPEALPLGNQESSISQNLEIKRGDLLRSAVPLFASTYFIVLLSVLIFSIIQLPELIEGLIRIRSAPFPPTCPVTCAKNIARINTMTALNFGTISLNLIFPPVFYFIQRKRARFHSQIFALRTDCTMLMVMGIGLAPHLFHFSWSKYGAVLSKTWALLH